MSDGNSNLTIRVGTNGVAASKADLESLGIAIKTLDGGAAKAGEHLAGMSYYARSGIDSIRAAAAGGGSRGVFYALDEGMRGLLASGMKLSTLVPVIGGIGAVAGGAYLAWEQWNKGVAETVQHAKDLTDAFQQLPGLIKQVSDMQTTGLLGAGAGGEYADYLTGRKKLYIDRESGEITPQATTTMSTADTGNIPFSVLAQGTSDFKGHITLPNDQLTDQSKIQKWVQDNITAGGEVTQTQLDALTKLHDLVTKYNAEGLTGIQKERQAVIDRYTQERDQIEQTLAVAKANLDTVSLAKSLDVKAAQNALTAMPGREAAELAALDQKGDQSAATISARSGADDLKSAYDETEDYITSKAIASGQERETYYKQEYGLRIGLAQEMLLTGQITERAYADAVRQSTSQMLEAQNRVNDALKQEQDLRAEIARGKLEANLSGIQDNPFLTTQQKTQQSIPLFLQQMQMNAGSIGNLSQIASSTTDVSAQLEAQKQIVALTQQQADLQAKLNAAQGANSWTFQLKAAATHFADINTLAHQTGQLLTGVLNDGINSISSNLTKVIDGTETWRKALLNIGESVVNTILQGIIKIALQQAVSYVEGLVMQEALQTTGTVQARLMATAWGPAAVAASIATEGTAAATGLAAALAAIAAGSVGFLSGGYTGHGLPGEVAGVVHKGEYVMSAPAVQRIGLPTLEAMHTGGSGSPSIAAAGSGQQMTHKVVVVMDRQGLLNEYKKQDFAQITVAHVFNNRMKAGINT